MSALLETLFFHALEVNLALSFVLIALLLASRWLFRRYGAGTRCFLWLVIAARLLVPANTTLVNALRLDPPLSQGDAGQVPSTIYVLTGQMPPPTPGVEAIAPSGLFAWVAGLNIPLLLALLWTAGVALFALYHLAAYLHTGRLLRRWSLPVPDEDTISLYSALREELGIHSPVALLQSSQVQGPLLLGYVRPAVILPTRSLGHRQLEDILRHELCHYKRGDLWKKLLLLCACAVNWFNPLVHLMVKQAEADIECACDRDVLKGRDSSRRRDYGLTILSLVEGGRPARTPLTTGFSSTRDAKLLKRRFREMVSTERLKTRKLLPALVLLCALLGSLFVGCGPRATADNSSSHTTVTQAAPETPLHVVVEQPTEPSETPLVAEEAEEDYTPQAANRKSQENLPPEEATLALPYPSSEKKYVTVGFQEYPGHTGVDFADGKAGGAVTAPKGGTVVTARHTEVGYGNYLVLDHGDDLHTLYAHLDEILVSDGDTVELGQQIGTIGSTGNTTGPNLHFEVRFQGRVLDPLPLLIGEGTAVVYVDERGFLLPVSVATRTVPVQTSAMHGVQLHVPNRTAVSAARGGTVLAAQNSYTGYGKHITIDHGDGYQTLYAHNDELLVEAGDRVKQGDTIAYSGRSGNATDYYLHFELHYNGKTLNPLDFIYEPGGGQEVGASSSPVAQNSASITLPVRLPAVNREISVIARVGEGNGVAYQELLTPSEVEGGTIYPQVTNEWGESFTVHIYVDARVYQEYNVNPASGSYTLFRDRSGEKEFQA